MNFKILFKASCFVWVHLEEYCNIGLVYIWFSKELFKVSFTSISYNGYCYKAVKTLL